MSSTHATRGRRGGRRWPLLVLTALGALLAVVLVASLSRPELRTGTAIEVETGEIGAGSTVEPQLEMAGYVALVGEGVAVYDAESGELTATSGHREPTGALPPLEVIQISEDGTALARDPRQEGRLALTRLTEQGAERLPWPPELWPRATTREELVSTAPDTITVAGCTAGDRAVLAGLDPTDLQVRWRRSVSVPAETCRAGLQPPTTDRYVVDPLHPPGRQRILDTRTGHTRPMDVPGLGDGLVSARSYQQTLGVVRDGRVILLDATTGAQRQQVEVCEPTDEPSWNETGRRPIPAQQRYPTVFCEPEEGAAGSYRAAVVDLADGTVSAPVEGLDQGHQVYLDDGGEPEPGEATVDDHERPVGPLLVRGTIITRDGDRIAGSDPFTGRERWSRDLELDEESIVRVSAAATGEQGMVEVGIRGGDRRETMLWDPADGSTLVHLDDPDRRLRVGPQGTVLLEDEDGDEDLVRPAEPSDRS